MREFTVFAPAKLNLYLDVFEKRSDGYHNIKTLFEKIDLKDEIIIREKGKGVNITAEPATCPSGEDNIVYRALQFLFKEARVNLDLEILIKKKIPVSGGLGGGSSDAAAVLRSINEVFELGVNEGRLFFIAGKTGKDVPFFMMDASFAIGMGAGDLLKPVDTDGCFSHIVIKPDASIATSEMYKRLDETDFTSRGQNIEETVSSLEKKDVTLLNRSCYNIFEGVLAEEKDVVEKAKTLLRDAGAGHSFLSGSGPSVFCTVKEKKEAMEILNRIPKEENRGIYLATTYKGGIYGDN
ncbi:4-(cytidine 5'-diphospho)-2-C-methyl-D-erythritol kinase [Candidatus Omnitrophota bacterium]